MFFSIFQLWDKINYKLNSKYTYSIILYIFIININDTRLGVLYLSCFILFLIFRLIKLRKFITGKLNLKTVKQNSWIGRILQLIKDGLLEKNLGNRLIRDYINPSLDTTISAISHLILLLSETASNSFCFINLLINLIDSFLTIGDISLIFFGIRGGNIAFLMTL